MFIDMVRILWKNVNTLFPIYKWLLFIWHEETLRNSKKTAFGHSDRVALYLKLKECTEREELFLNKDLSLSYLSKKLRTNSTYLSKAVNSVGKKTFIDFVHEYRIDYAKKLLLNEDFSIYTIQTIAEKSGFRSTSVFYNAFKKQTSIAPGEFLKRKKNVRLREKN